MSGDPESGGPGGLRGCRAAARGVPTRHGRDRDRVAGGRRHVAVAGGRDRTSAPLAGPTRRSAAGRDAADRLVAWLADRDRGDDRVGRARVSEETAIVIDDESVACRGRDHRPSSPSRRVMPSAPIAHVGACRRACRSSNSRRCSPPVATKGQLTQAELIEALHTVELTPEVLTALIDRVTAEGVALVEDEEEDPIVEVVPHKEPGARPAIGRTAATNGSTRPSARREPSGRRASSASPGAAPRTPSTPT